MFVQQNYSQYTILYEPLPQRLVGVRQELVRRTRKPREGFKRLMEKPPKDALLKALYKVFNLITTRSMLRIKDFGAFGSLLHSFYHPNLSDLDLIVYGRKKLGKLRENLKEFYQEGSSPLRARTGPTVNTPQNTKYSTKQNRKKGSLREISPLEAGFKSLPAHYKMLAYFLFRKS